MRDISFTTVNDGNEDDDDGNANDEQGECLECGSIATLMGCSVNASAMRETWFFSETIWNDFEGAAR